MMGDEIFPPLGATTSSIADDSDTKAIAVATTADLLGSNMTFQFLAKIIMDVTVQLKCS